MSMTTAAAHTSGPWKWHWRFEDGLANGSVYAEPRAGHAYAVAICPKYQSREQWEADARLIAAAPELLAALKIVREKSYLPTHCAAIIDAALAKAEGGAA